MVVDEQVLLKQTNNAAMLPRHIGFNNDVELFLVSYDGKRSGIENIINLYKNAIQGVNENLTVSKYCKIFKKVGYVDF